MDIVDASKRYWSEMHKYDSKDYLWDDLSGNTSNASTRKNRNHVTKVLKD